MPDHDIEEYVSQMNNLSVKENKGARFRITHNLLKKQAGSLWFQAYTEKYRLYPTGEVISLLNIIGKLGEPDGQDMGRDYWFTNNLEDIKKSF